MTELKKKPLVEAILEVRWQGPRLQAGPPLPVGDPHYQLLLGRFYDRIRAIYPAHEPLPAAQVPAEIVGQVVQHRFRPAPNTWPLVQLGPGIVTLNETSRYTWTDFRLRAVQVVENFCSAHPNLGALKLQKLTLRYLDAIAFDPSATNITDFLRDQLKLTVSLPTSIFGTVGIEQAPRTLQWQASFRTPDDSRILSTKVSSGKKAKEPAIILDTSVETTPTHLPQFPEEFPAWIDASHEIASGWFKELTKGLLYDSFEPVQTVG